jgi:hypothetical protein
VARGAVARDAELAIAKADLAVEGPCLVRRLRRGGRLRRREQRGNLARPLARMADLERHGVVHLGGVAQPRSPPAATTARKQDPRVDARAGGGGGEQLPAAPVGLAGGEALGCGAGGRALLLRGLGRRGLDYKVDALIGAHPAELHLAQHGNLGLLGEGGRGFGRRRHPVAGHHRQRLERLTALHLDDARLCLLVEATVLDWIGARRRRADGVRGAARATARRAAPARPCIKDGLPRCGDGLGRRKAAARRGVAARKAWRREGG